MEDFVLVAEVPGEEVVEISLEPDGSVGIDTLCGEFGRGVTGFSYINPATGSRRIVRVSRNSLLPPGGKWTDNVHYVRRCQGEFVPDVDGSGPEQYIEISDLTLLTPHVFKQIGRTL